MAIQKSANIIAWQRAQDDAVKIYIAFNTETQYIIVQKKGTNPECFRDVVRHYHSTNQIRHRRRTILG